MTFTIPEPEARKYARLLLRAGLDFRPGQNLAVAGEPIHWPFFNILVEEAYKAGAHYVDVDAPHARVGRARVDHAPGASLDFIPAHRRARIDMMLDGTWSRLYLDGAEDPDLFADVDQARNGTIRKAVGQVSKPLMDACGAGRVPWCVAALPTAGWANRVFNGTGDAEALWRLMVPILRLDHDDPDHTWHALAAASQTRCGHLNEGGFARIRFAAPGTALTVTCIPECHWEGGFLQSPDGERTFIPNLPTEEVFTTPDWRHTEGRAAITRPVDVMGKPVKGAWFEFREGKVADFGADDGREQLEAYFNVDDRGRYLGEIALVGCDSPIFTSGHNFGNILYDENAACHIALGSGYPLLDDPEATTPDEKQALGINQSLVHTDFMIGCAEMDVTGIGGAGEETAIMRQGRFVTPFTWTHARRP